MQHLQNIPARADASYPTLHAAVRAGFPCVCAWLYSPTLEAGIDEWSQCRQVILLRGGVQLKTGPHRGGCMGCVDVGSSTLSMPFDRITACHVVAAAAPPSGRVASSSDCCCRQIGVGSSLSTVVIELAYDEEGELPERVELRGLEKPQAFAEAVLAMQRSLPGALQQAAGESKGQAGSSGGNSMRSWLRSVTRSFTGGGRMRGGGRGGGDGAQYREMVL